MATPLGNNDRQPRTPSLRLNQPGEYIDGFVVDEEPVPLYVFGTKERAQTKAGKPKTQDKVTILVTGGTGQILDLDANGETIPGPDDKPTYRPVAAGDIGAVFIKNSNRWDPDEDDRKAPKAPKSWSGAKQDAGSLFVGDRIRWSFDRNQPGKGAEPRKVHLFQLRRPKPEEAAQAQRCEQIRHELHATQLSGNMPGAEEPF